MGNDQPALRYFPRMLGNNGPLFTVTTVDAGKPTHLHTLHIGNCTAQAL